MTEAKAAEIEKLIERLEKLTGPDARVDDAIQAHCVPRSERTIQAPRFTKSIDAALTLVPEGGGCVGVWKIIKGSSGCVGEIDLGRWKGWHETSPVIALCIASLKAIAALRALSHKGSSND